jgi:hypothetical protein
MANLLSFFARWLLLAYPWRAQGKARRSPNIVQTTEPSRFTRR